MKILVPVKRVPDPYGRVRLTADGRIDDSELKWVINPFDEIALEEAVRIRESGAAGDVEILAVGIGPEVWQEQLRTALAMGADRALHVLDDSPPDAAITAMQLAAVFRRELPNLVLMGKQAIDDDAGQVGPRLAALLDLPLASFASKITLTANTALVEREVDAGRETVELPLPAVITADLRLNEPRYIALPAIVRARSRPIDRNDASELGARPQSRLRLVSLEMPPPRKAGRRVANVAELVDALRNEAGVL